MADDRKTGDDRLDTASGALLWRRWQAACDAAAATTGGDDTPDFMALAALAEDRLAQGDERAALDRALALDPALIDDVAAARDLAARFDAVPATDPWVVERAAALVASPAAARPAAEIHAFPQRPARGGAQRRPFSVGYTLRWAALAASFALTGYFGFALGSDAYSSLLAADTAAQSSTGSGTLIDLIDPPAGIFSGASETTGA